MSASRTTSPATCGGSHVRAIAWGRRRNPTAPVGAAQSVSFTLHLTAATEGDVRPGSGVVL